ncbi:Hsp20/alpha crystallin family protein [Adhaeribacter rhizoryzae]|uniref:Hsp20/alpha crystallin family protein n=1 Tax=Adhaeribacter rhizoryzae TaxID=2607907 RepID=A0A5M6DF97_9BACT|nr:Hsp20/alpha crystallin family protein [Adhaeribacter rhizoryzae]KAA5545060.1 Hsp20/alpha crystallin family protein [Adhaeribacter rhizoryzae]
MAIQKFGGLMDDFVPPTFSSMIDRFFQDSVNQRRHLTDFSPQVDACETESGFEIELTLPGLKKEDIKIELQEGRLTVSGERKFRNEDTNKRYQIIESQYGSFSRSFQLPNNIDPNAISAEFQDGILRLTVPKDQQKTQKHQIQIKDDATQTRVAQGQNASDSGQQNNQSGENGQNGQTINIDQHQKKTKASK